MNNLQPYEKYLADKLEQAPVPDKNEGWIEMRKLLDEELPEGGTGWSGNRKWWWMGLTVAIIISGVWLSQQFKEKEQRNDREAIAAPSSINEKKEPSNLTTSPAIIKANESNQHKEPNTAVYPNAENSQQKIVEAESRNNVKRATIDDKNNPTPTRFNSENRTSERRHDVKKVLSNPSEKTKAKINLGSGAFYASTQQNHDKNNISDIKNSTEATLSNSGDILSQQSIAGSAYSIKTPEELAVISTSLNAGDITDLTYQDASKILGNTPLAVQPMKAEPGKTDKAFAKEMRTKSMGADNRKMSKRSMRGVSGEKDHELTFAAGLALPQSFAIGSQQSPAYGINAKTGKASDYVPVPFFQYHVNNHMFLQTELQFQAPQFTDRLLISQSQRPVAPTNGMLERNIYVEKLYYFHIPINLYFSPIKNFYFGTGLQYSSLLSGVATYQDNTYSNGSLQNSNSRVQGFKDDSVSAKLAPSEWRYQLEANYYIRRFTLGARYNQALSQFVNLQPSSTLPLTQGRNQTFLISLRYNIWEERKKSAYYTDAW